MARDATARQYDVDAYGVKLDIDKGLITFQAKKGGLVDLDKLHESIWATRLSGGTGMGTNWLDVTAVGEVVVQKDRVVLKVTGTDGIFVLQDVSKSKPGDKSPLSRLRESAQDGQKQVSVTGRVDGWKGHFPPFLKTLPKKPRVILVQEFEVVK